MPKGVVARVHDDHLAADQEAAMEHARQVHERIYWNIKRRMLAEERKNHQ